MILRVKVTFSLFCFMSNETVQSTQNSNKSMIKK